MANEKKHMLKQQALGLSQFKSKTKEMLLNTKGG